MKRTDLESSRPLSLPEPISAGLSTLLHALLVFGAMTWASVPKDSSADDLPESAQFLYPLLRPRPRPVEEHLSYVGLGGTEPRDVEVGEKPNSVKVMTGEKAAAASAPAPVPEEPPHAYSEIEVDSAVVRDPDSVGPVYPQNLLEAHIEGGTTVRFIVDSTGRVDPASILILESTHTEFTQAVREALPKMKYQAARMGRRPVAQLVEQRFGFRITPLLIQ